MSPKAGDLVKYCSADAKKQKHIGIGVITFANCTWFFVEWLWVNDPWNTKPEKWRKDFQYAEFGIRNQFTVLS